MPAEQIDLICAQCSINEAGAFGNGEKSERIGDKPATRDNGGNNSVWDAIEERRAGVTAKYVA